MKTIIYNNNKVTRNQLLNSYFNLNLEKDNLENKGLDKNGSKVSYGELVEQINYLNPLISSLQKTIVNYNQIRIDQGPGPIIKDNPYLKDK